MSGSPKRARVSLTADLAAQLARERQRRQAERRMQLERERQVREEMQREQVREQMQREQAAAEEERARAQDLQRRLDTVRDELGPVPELARVDEALGLVDRDLRALRLDDVRRSVDRVEQEVETLEAKVDDVVARLEERRVIIEGLRDGLAELGFEIDQQSHRSDASGTVGFRARHITGWGLAMTVGSNAATPTEDEIQYAVEKSMIQVEEREGGVVRRCDAAADILRELHERVRGKGIDVGRLTWEGMPEDPAGARAQPPQEIPGDRGITA